MKRLFTSESVTEGHPDKVCDAVSDAILDAALREDSNSRVACECCVKTGFILVFGEMTTNAHINIENIARKTITEIGYDDSSLGFDGNTCSVLTALGKQSSDIAMGVDNSIEHRETGSLYDTIGAGDQGMMFGYATDETADYMPLPISLAHRLTRRLTEVRKKGILKYLRPDGKAQVTVEYNDEIPVRVDSITLSSQHSEDVTIEKLREDLKKFVIQTEIPEELIDDKTKYYINPTGRFVIGGPYGDSGLTGRKIIVDTYGGYIPHGGGAFSGKDPTKVDRSAAYYCRYVAKNLVAAGLARKCEIQVAYAIGKANPVSISVKTFGTGVVSDEKIADIISENFDFRPQAIIDYLDLKKPIYSETTNYGHFGKEGLSWERLDMAELLAKYRK